MSLDARDILAALELTGGDETKASHLLGIDLRTLRLGGRLGWADLTVTRIYPKSSPGQSE